MSYLKLNGSFPKNIILTLAFGLLFLHLMAFPRAPFDTTHDSSSAATFEYYAVKKVQFGTDVFQNIGPLGYVLYSDDFTGLLHWQKIILKNISRMGLVVLAGWLMRQLTSPVPKICWFAGFFIFYSFGDASNRDYLDLHDNLAYLTIYLQGIWLLQNRDDRLFRALSLVGWFFLAFLSLNKNTFFIFACGIVLVITAQNLYRRKSLRAINGLIAFSTSLAAIWALSSQHIENLPSFIYGVFAFSSGYNEALALETPRPPLLLGITILVLFGGRIINGWWYSKREFGKAAIEALVLFIVWKHGFVRSDEHMLIFFYAALLLAVPVFYYNSDRIFVSSMNDSSSAKKRLNNISCLAVYAICLISFPGIIHNCHYKPMRLWNHLHHNASWFASPLAETNEMVRQLGEAQSASSLPSIRDIVGQSTIDFFGFEPGYLLLNKLNYVQRPMPITFAAVNTYLQEANENFYHDPAKAPEFVLFQSGGIDNRLFIQDDALAKRALIDNYRPVLLESGLLLFQQRQKSTTMPPHLNIIAREQVLKFSQSMPLGDLNRQPLWLEVKIERTVVGKLLAFFYKPPPCYISLQFEGEQQTHSYKFVTTMGDCGFMINPYLGNNSDMANYFDQQKSIENMVRVARLSFECNKRDMIFFKDKIQVTLRLLERPKY